MQCDTNGDHGCKGGLMDNAFEWIAEGNPLCTESTYPYTSGAGLTGTCKKACNGEVSLTSHKARRAGRTRQPWQMLCSPYSPRRRRPVPTPARRAPAVSPPPPPARAGRSLGRRRRPPRRRRKAARLCGD